MLCVVKKLSAQRFNSFLLLLLLSLFTHDSVQAQVLYGGLTGDVTDSTGAAIPGTVVVALNEETNQSREAITNHAGRYAFVTLPSGRYTLSVKLSGFKEA